MSLTDYLTPEELASLKGQTKIGPAPQGEKGRLFLQKAVKTTNLPIIAGALAGILARNPSAGILGYVGTKQLEDILMSKLGAPQEEPLTTAGQFRKLPGQAMEAAAAEVGGNILGRIPGFLSAPFKSSLKPGVDRLLKVAESKGVPINPAEATESRALDIAQRSIENIPFTAGVAQKRGLEARAGLQRMGQQFRQQVGPPIKDVGVVGRQISEDIGSAANIFRTEAGKLYDDVERLSGTKGYYPGNFSDTAKEILGKESNAIAGLKNSEIIGRTRKILGNLTKSEPKLLGEATKTTTETVGIDKTFGQLRSARSALNELARHPEVIGTKAEGAYQRMAAAVEKDIEEFAAKHGGDILTAYKKATQFYASGKGVLNRAAITNLRKVAEEKPGLVVQTLIKPKQPEAVARIKGLVDDNTFSLIKRQFTDDLIEQSMVRAQGQKDYYLMGGKLSELTRKYGDDVLETIYTKDELAALKDLGDISSLSLSSITASKPGTQSGALGTIGLGAAALSPGPILGFASSAPASAVALSSLGSVAALRAGAELILSPFGRKWLSTGFKLPPGVQRAGQAAGYVGGAKLFQ